jgi:putative tryptophan/tyrosine transport system substrate-binding protein
VRRRDFTICLLLAAATRSARAQEPAKQHRIAIVIASGPVTRLNDPASHAWQAFWAELRRLGDVEGQNLTVERYSGEGRPEGYADLARQIVSRNPEVIVPISPPILRAVSAATGTIPIVGSGAYTSLGLVPSLARPVGNVTGNHRRHRVRDLWKAPADPQGSRPFRLLGSLSWICAHPGKVPSGNSLRKSLGPRADGCKSP